MKNPLGTPGTRSNVLPPRWGGILIGIMCLTVAYSTGTSIPHPHSFHDYATWATALGCVVFLVLIYEYPGSQLLLVGGLLGSLLEALLPGGPSLAVTFAVIAISGIRLPEEQSRVVAGVTAVTYVAAQLLSGRAYPVGALISLIPGLMFAYAASVGVRRLREEQRRTQELLQEVVANRDAQVRAAALDERSRLAREIHDILAHTLSALSVQLEGARLVLERRPDDPAGLAAIERARGLAREGLEETRRAVSALRGDILIGTEQLQKLVDDFERDTGVPARIEIQGTAPDLSADEKLTIYRTAQEALTNIRKHTVSTRVRLLLAHGANGVILEVENKGTAHPQPLPSGGYGLGGLRERAALLGGTLDAGPTDRGFLVRLWLPVQAVLPSES